MRIQTRAFLSFVTVALTAVSFADGFAIKRTPKEGVLVKYTSVIDFDVNGGQGNMAATVSEKIVSVDKDGNYTVEQSQLSASGTFNKEKIEIPARNPFTMTYKPNGQVTLIKGDLIDALSYRMENLATIIDPGKLVNVDDAWSADFKADKELGSVAAHADYKLVAEEKIGTVDTLKIKATIKETVGDNPATSEFTEWISKEDGSMVQLETTWKNAPFPGVSYPVNAVIKMNRVAS